MDLYFQVRIQIWYATVQEKTKIYGNKNDFQKYIISTVYGTNYSRLCGVSLYFIFNFSFKFSNMEINCESGALIAGTLANGGVCPISGDQVGILNFLFSNISFIL